MTTLRLKLEDRYEIERELASGAMGTAYLARDRVIDRLVVLKTLHEAEPDSQQGVDDARLIEEARSAARISHPNVVTVYDVLGDETSGRTYLALEYVEGRTLAEILDRETLSTDQAVSIALQVAAGLAHLHDVGLIHRDIKPSNILVDRKGIAKITDFGIARTAGRTQLEHDGSVLGTPPYMAPEQLLGQTVDAVSDVYSLGAVLYEMLAGRKPIEAQSVTGVARRTLRAEVTPLEEVAPRVPKALRSVVERAMSREATARFRSAAELATALRAAAGLTSPVDLAMLVVADARVHARPTTMLPGTRLRRLVLALRQWAEQPWATRLRLGILVVTLAVVIGLLAGWWVFQRTAAQGAAVEPEPADAQVLVDRLLQETQRLLDADDAQGAMTVAALVERLSPGSSDAAALRSKAEQLARQLGVESEARSAEAEVRAGPGPQAVRAARKVIERAASGPERAGILSELSSLSEAFAVPADKTRYALRLRSDSAHGTITVYAGGAQVFQQRFAFTRRRGLLRRPELPGALDASFEVDADQTELRVYVTRRGEAAKLTELVAPAGGGSERVLDIFLPSSGEPEVRLR